MIETLLPDCMVVHQKGPQEFGFKMLELWGDKGMSRRGWLAVTQEWFWPVSINLSYKQWVRDHVRKTSSTWPTDQTWLPWQWKRYWRVDIGKVRSRQLESGIFDVKTQLLSHHDIIINIINIMITIVNEKARHSENSAGRSTSCLLSWDNRELTTFCQRRRSL